MKYSILFSIKSLWTLDKKQMSLEITKWLEAQLTSYQRSKVQIQKISKLINRSSMSIIIWRKSTSLRQAS